MLDVEVVLTGRPECDNNGERPERRHRVGEKVEHESGATQPGTNDQGDKDVSGMRNAGVRKQPLDVSLSQSDNVTDDHRQRGEPPHRFVPGRKQCRKRLEPQAEERSERRSLHCRCHVSRDWGWRSLVSIGRPHVKRCRGDLEAESNQ